MIQNVTPVFVYGTLKHGGRLHEYIKHCPFFGHAAIRNHTLIDVTGGHYPHMVESASRDDIVLGEVYMVDEHTLAVLDQIENGYQRLTREAQMFSDDLKLIVAAYVDKRHPDVKPPRTGRVSWVPTNNQRWAL